MKRRESTMISEMLRLLYVYNAFVVMSLALFMCITQRKIIQSMTARSFLENISAPPASSTEILFWTASSFTVLSILGKLYRREDRNDIRKMLFAAEIIVCMILMRSLNLVYDGVVLLVAADLMYRYEGNYREYILLAAMLGLYFMANYNLAIFQLKVIHFDAYLSYYNSPMRSFLAAVKNIFSSLNVVIFVFYMVMIVKNRHEEKERIRLLNEQLAVANEKLRLYAIQSEQMAEIRERNRLAREIHDTLGHALTGIAAGLDACTMLIDSAPEFAKQQLIRIRETARRGIVDVRRSIKKLRPDDLEKLSFKDAIMNMTTGFAASSGVDVGFTMVGVPKDLREDQQEVLYRVMQESLTNAYRHGGASRVNISIVGGEGRLRIVIADNGRGCDDVKPGFGLRHMRERLELLHGTLNYWSDEGFIVEVEIPLNREVRDDKNIDSR